jgi:hypothetical protein|nr:MAG TPA: aerobic respiration control sensor protein [Caudoviricetes sp.]
MTLYAISAVLIFCACIIESFRKHGTVKWVNLARGTAVAAVLALPTVLPLLIFLICAFDLKLEASK